MSQSLATHVPMDIDYKRQPLLAKYPAFANPSIAVAHPDAPPAPQYTASHEPFYHLRKTNPDKRIKALGRIVLDDLCNGANLDAKLLRYIDSPILIDGIPCCASPRDVICPVLNIDHARLIQHSEAKEYKSDTQKEWERRNRGVVDVGVSFAEVSPEPDVEMIVDEAPVENLKVAKRKVKGVRMKKTQVKARE